jgi:hypothetical protein
MVPRLGSNFDGEVVATVRAIERVLHSAGCDWHDLAAAIVIPDPKPSTDDWRALMRFCIARGHSLSGRDFDFLATLAQRNREPSVKQHRWLQDIAARLRDGEDVA